MFMVWSILRHRFRKLIVGCCCLDWVAACRATADLKWGVSKRARRYIGQNLSIGKVAVSALRSRPHKRQDRIELENVPKVLEISESNGPVRQQHQFSLITASCKDFSRACAAYVCFPFFLKKRPSVAICNYRAQLM